MMCNVPYLGYRQCDVLPGCPPALSVRQEVDDHGVIFSYTHKDGPKITLRNGTEIYLEHANRSVPVISGYSKSKAQPNSRNQRTETLPTQDTAAYTCLPCGQVPWPGTQARVTAMNTPTKAVGTTGSTDAPRSGGPSSPKRTLPILTASYSASERRKLCPERLRDGKTPILYTPWGYGNRGSARRSCALSQCQTGKLKDGKPDEQVDLPQPCGWSLLRGGLQRVW